jgi:NAD(P)-dependent dehydrogenase (short-subunit alcohol dehydrogenase family)
VPPAHDKERHIVDLANTRVLIVGGTSGIGFAVATAVADARGIPIVVSRRQESVDRALAGLPSTAEGTNVDLSDPASVARMVEFAGAVDHLVYTAGEPLSLVHLADITPDVIRSFFDTRYIGAVTTVRAIAPKLRAGGSITLTSGSAGDRPGAGWALAASICGAMNSLTKALAVELAPLRVNAISPGVLRSPLWDGMTEEDREAMYGEIGAGLPLGRVGEVQDVALAYIYAMTQSYGTGVVLPVDGGTLLA